VVDAGVLDTDGKGVRPETDRSQGSIISPILANVYLHHALDVWFQKVVISHCIGKAFLIRFADVLCVRLKTGRCPTFLCSIGKTVGEIWTGIIGRENADNPVQARRLSRARPVLTFWALNFDGEKTEKGSRM